MKRLKLPQKIKVKIKKTEDNTYLIELPEYDAFTEVDSSRNIDVFVNDLIFCLFDVPKRDWKKIRYIRLENKPLKTRVSSILPFVLSTTYSSKFRYAS